MTTQKRARVMVCSTLSNVVRRRISSSSLMLWGMGVSSFFGIMPSAGAASVIDVSPGADIKTLTSSLQAGDVVQFADGLYEIESTLDWDGVGTQGAPITFKAAPGAEPVIQMNVTGYVAYLHDASYVNIEGLSFRGPENLDNAYYSALVLERTQNINIRDCRISQKRGHGIYVVESTLLNVERTEIFDLYDGNHGIYLDGSNSRFSSGITLHNNWIHNLAGSNAGGIVVATSVFGNTFSDNVIHAVENRGIYLASYTNGDPNIIERNVIFSVGNALIEAYGSATIRNNILFNSNGYGIYASPGSQDAAATQHLVHNTIVNTLNRAVFYKQSASEASIAFALVNNALCSPLTFAFKSEGVGEANVGQTVVSNNVACGLVEAYEGILSGFIPGAGYADYTDAAVWNFWPTQESYLLEAGIAPPSELDTDEDFNGLTRDASAPDVGAYERLYPENPGWVLAEGFKSLEITLPEAEEPVESGCKGCGGAEPSTAILGPCLTLGLGALLMRRRRQGR